MPPVNKIDFKNKEDIRKYLLKNYLKIDKNLFSCERIFIANSAINWILEHTKNPDVIKHYISDIHKYLNGDYELKWINGVLTKKKVIKNDKI